MKYIITKGKRRTQGIVSAAQCEIVYSINTLGTREKASASPYIKAGGAPAADLYYAGAINQVCAGVKATAALSIRKMRCINY